jgi:hypothetical protein
MEVPSAAVTDIRRSRRSGSHLLLPTVAIALVVFLWWAVVASSLYPNTLCRARVRLRQHGGEIEAAADQRVGNRPHRRTRATSELSSRRAGRINRCSLPARPSRIDAAHCGDPKPAEGRSRAVVRGVAGLWRRAQTHNHRTRDLLPDDARDNRRCGSITRSTAYLARSMGCRSFAFLRYIQLPTDAPFIAAAFRTSATLAVVGALVAEFVGSIDSLGTCC